MSDDDLAPLVFDAGDGVTLEFPVGDGVTLKVYMTDNACYELIKIIQNKLNARYGT